LTNNSSSRNPVSNFQQQMAAMSFDDYFQSSERMSHRSKNSDDWYAIVEEALFAADEASRRHRQQLEAGLMKPLPVIPEDDAADSLAMIKELHVTCRPISATTVHPHQKGTDSKQKSSPWTDDKQCYVLDIPNDRNTSRRPSSVYSAEPDSPLSLESFELDTWASEVCATVQSGMSSLRNKPYTRPSSATNSSAVSQRSVSIGSSILANRPRSTSSSVYSTDTSVDSHGSPTHSACMHSRNLSANSETQPKHVASEEEEEGSKTLFSFFDFSDDEEEGAEVTVARPESSASNYVKHLRRKALSLRMPTSKKSQIPVRILSVPSRDGPAWFFRSLSTSRSSMLSVDSDIVMENELMAGAAASAKAKRVLGLR
jgi:hypothetical protein